MVHLAISLKSLYATYNAGMISGRVQSEELHLSLRVNQKHNVNLYKVINLVIISKDDYVPSYLRM